MSEISRLMKMAADEPTEKADVEAAWRRGRALRTRRTILVSVTALIVILGAGFTFARTVPREDAFAPADGGTESGLIEEAACEDQFLPDEQVLAYCVARGTYDGEPWFYGAYIDDEGHLCTYLEEPGAGAGGGCGDVEDIRQIRFGLSSGGPAGPILAAEVPVDSSRVVIDTEDTGLVETSVYDAPEELELSLRFALLFELPKDAKSVVAFDASGAEIARRSLVPLLDLGMEREMPAAESAGWMLANGMLEGEPWGLSARNQQAAEIPCVELGLGNDAKAADVEIGATACFDVSEAGELAMEQMWWEGLGDRAPVFGIVGRDVHRIELRFDDGRRQRIPIRHSPAEGLWRDEPIYPVDFVVAFPPVGPPGEMVALDRDGTVMATWRLCMSAHPQGTHGSCDPTTEFWFPPGGD